MICNSQIGVRCAVLFAITTAGLAPSTALADCPSVWAGLACDSRCTTTSTNFTCSVSGAGGASKVIMVENYDAATEYEAWGDYNGDTFCCASAAEYDPSSFLITGSAYVDTLKFIDALSGSELQPTSATVITAVINGGASADTIYGSDQALYYSETLNGDAGDDFIWAGADADICDGGNDEDTIVGGGGADYLYGGSGNDTISGSDGDDFIFGETGIDAISGGNDDDTIDGGAGGDTICGDNETAGNGDYLDDGDSVVEATPDQLWGANGDDLLECYDGTSVDSSSTLTARCISYSPDLLTSKPAACP